MASAEPAPAATAQQRDLLADMQTFFEAIEGGDRETVFAITERRCHPECEIFSAVSGHIEGLRRGHDQIKALLADLLDVWQFHYSDMRFQFVRDEAVVLRYRQRLEGRGSGIVLDATGGVIWWLEGDRTTKVVTYTDADELERTAAAIEEGDA
jgi:hypothetical protein